MTILPASAIWLPYEHFAIMLQETNHFFTSQCEQIGTLQQMIELTNLHQNVSIHSTYHTAYAFGSLAIIFINFTVSSNISAWGGTLFKIASANFLPKYQERIKLTDEIVLYTNTNGEIAVQDAVPAGTYNLIAPYIRSL